jgi:hypothetical protein
MAGRADAMDGHNDATSGWCNRVGRCVGISERGDVTRRVAHRSVVGVEAAAALAFQRAGVDELAQSFGDGRADRLADGL